MDPISVALGVGGIASTLLNNQSQQDMFNRSLDWQKYQYEDMKKYNSAKAQVERLRAAGMNPAFMFGQNSGQASATSSPSPANTSPLDLNGLASIAQGINMNDVQAKNIEANTNKTNISSELDKVDLAFKEQDWLSKLYNRDSDTWYKNMYATNIKLNNQYLQDTMKDRIWQQKMESQVAQAHAYAQQYLLPYVPLKAQAEIDNLAAQTKLAYDTGAATLQQAMAALTQSYVAKAAMQAQFGKDPKARERWWQQSFKMLQQNHSESQSREFNNYLFKGDFSVGPTGISYPQAYSYDKSSKSFKRH